MLKNMIIQNDDNEKAYNLKTWNKIVTEEGIDIDLMTLEGKISYSISVDRRESNLTSIEKFITEEVESAIKGESVLYISEYLQRLYIYIGKDMNRRQFTACRK